MAQDRHSIPAEIRRRVLVEAGHRCAIPTCRHIEVDIHHIIPWERCKKHEYENLIALCPNCHRRADRGEIDRKSLRCYKANLIVASNKFSPAEIDYLFALVKIPRIQGIQFPPYMAMFIKRLLDARYVELRKLPHGSVSSLGPQIRPDLLIITEEGHRFIKSLGLELDN